LEVFYSELNSELSQSWSLWFSNYKNRLQNQGVEDQNRLSKMKRINPRFILRNYMLEQAIQQAEQGDFSLLNEFSELIKTPYEDSVKADKWVVKKPVNAGDSSLSCSS
jgi:uncharacterized protein YdiU (UPF0061 family)